MDIYENIVIGNFLFMLGVTIGVRSAQAGAPIALSTNLIQQTPLDKPLGDVFLKSDRLFRVIEFKRSAAESKKKEHEKLAKLRATLASDSWRAFSRGFHWFVRSDFNKGATLIDAVPYLDFDNKACPNRLLFQAFIDDIANTALFGREHDKDFADACAKYLDHLLKVEGSGAGEASGALLLVVDAQGNFRFVVFDKFIDLAMSLSEAIKRENDQQQTQSQDRDLGRERGPRKGINR